MALYIRIREVADIGPQYPLGYKIKDVLILPKNFTKGARATKRLSTEPQRTSVRFNLAKFEKIVRQIEKLAQSGTEINPEDFYPEIKKKGGKTRELPLVDIALRKSIERYLDFRLLENPQLKVNHPLILSQKGSAYSPNTLEDHMRTMLRDWTGIDRASSHSGRRSLATKLLHEQGEHLKTVQQILGHKDAATTVIYHQLPESEIKKVLKKAGKAFDKD
ncbi:MAG: tyrosine-type recombinase/integrase [Pseudomonadales bacterium]|nr:tyrosine-type recombinase/integrase [Pseudomonadales bacterium]MBL4868417.1 tyrosine-type recombinase/integrase [Pseudomonadales bacterium]